MANSALYATHEAAETIHEATMRIGMRAVRRLIFSVSVRGAVLRGGGLKDYAEEVWRQSLSVATVAREIAPSLGFEREKAYLLALLHDIGKVSLLAMLRHESSRDTRITRGLVGKLFYRYHERAGQAMAEAWNLSPEFASVAGRHHDYRANEEYGRGAAMVCLAHRMDLLLSRADHAEYRALLRSDEFEFLGVSDGARERALLDGRRGYEEAADRRRSEARAAA
jgi:putative nucleotidyltransferase with HDIG domain